MKTTGRRKPTIEAGGGQASAGGPGAEGAHRKKPLRPKAKSTATQGIVARFGLKPAVGVPVSGPGSKHAARSLSSSSCSRCAVKPRPPSVVPGVVRGRRLLRKQGVHGEIDWAIPRITVTFDTSASALWVKWTQRADLSECKHLNLELEWNDLGHSTGNDSCIVCGESVAHKPRASVSN